MRMGPSPTIGIVVGVALLSSVWCLQDSPELAAGGRTLLKTASVASSYVGLGNPDTQYAGVGQNVYVGNNNGLEVGSTIGTTANVDGVSTVGIFADTAGSQGKNPEGPNMNAEVGVVMSGQPLGVRMSSNTLFPSLTTNPSHPAVDYGTAKTAKTAEGRRRLRQNYVLGLGDPAANYIGAGIKFTDKGAGQGSISEGFTINRDGASVLGEFGSLSGPTNPKAQIGYVSNGQPLGIKLETPKGQTGPNVAVITGIVDPAVNFGDINPGRKLQQLPNLGAEIPELPQELPITPTVMDFSLPAGLGLPNGLHVTDGINVIPGEGTLKGRAVGLTAGSIADVSGNTKTATVGNYRSVQISDATATSLPVLTAETGVIVNGLPYGVKVSSDNPLPQPSNKSPAKILGRRLQQLPNPAQLPNPVVIGAGDEAGNYIGTSSGVITVEGKEGNAVAYTAGSTVNLAAAPTTGNQVVGEFRNIKIASNPAGGAPVVSGQVGAVVGGQPFGISLSSAKPLPEPVNKVDLTAVPYSGVPEVGRKLQQVGQPLILGFGDPAGNYIGGGNGVIPGADGALYTGGETLNLAGAPAGQLAGDFRNVKIGVDSATGMPYARGQVGAIIGGQPAGIDISSSNPFPTPVEKITEPAVPYTTSGRKLLEGESAEAGSQPAEAAEKPAQAGSPVVIGVGDPAKNFIGEGNGIVSEGNTVTYTGGLTVNTENTPTPIGDFRNVVITTDPANPLPTVSTSAGAVVGGQVLGLGVSTSNPIPTAVTGIKTPAVPYKTLPTGSFSGRKLLQGPATPVVLGLGNPAGNYIASGNSVLTDGASPNGFAGGVTINTPNDGTALGDWRSVKFSNDPVTGAPVATAEWGVVVLGEAQGVSVSTANALPKTITNIQDATLPYRPNPGRKLAQQLPPILVGVGNPNATYLGTGFSLIPGTGAEADIPAGLTGGSTLNLGGEAVGPILGEFRSAQVKTDAATGVPVVKAQMGVIIAGQPIGMEFTSSALPRIVTTVSDPAVPYNFMMPGRRLLEAAKAYGRRLLQPSIGGGYISFGDPKKGTYQGVGVDVYAGDNRDKGQALGVATGYANNTNGKSKTGTFSDTYVSSKTTQENPVAGELGVLFDGWKIGMKQEPGKDNAGLTLGITRPVLPYNGEKVPDYGAKGAGAKGGEGTPPASDDEGSSATGSDGSTTPTSTPATDSTPSSPASSSESPSSPTSSSSTPSSPTSSSSPAEPTSPSSSSSSPDASASPSSPLPSSGASPDSPSTQSSTAISEGQLVTAESSSVSLDVGPARREDVVPLAGDATSSPSGVAVSSSAFPG